MWSLAPHPQLRSRLKVTPVTASAPSTDENVSNAAKNCCGLLHTVPKGEVRAHFCNVCAKNAFSSEKKLTKEKTKS
jgi:hypothetical protein